jgi:hypothetical protein
LWKELNIPSIFTLEASFCGGTNGPNSEYHYTTQCLKQIGRDLCRCLIHECKTPLYNEVSNLPAFSQSISYFESLKHEAENAMQNEKLIVESDSDSGSDGNPSDGNLDDKLVKMVLPVNNRGKGRTIIQ